MKDLKDRKLYAIEKPGTYQLLEPLIGDTVETAAVVSQWAVLLRLKASIQAGRVMPSVILRKLAAAGSGNALSRALRALGRIERTLFTCNGCPILICVSAAMPGSTRARRATPYAEQFSSTARARFVTGPSRTRAFGHPA